MDTAIPPAIAAQLTDARAVLQQHLGDDVIGVHLFGSAVKGGLKPSSDIDLLVTVQTAPNADVRHALMQALLAVSAPPRSHAARRALEVTVLAHDQVVPCRYPARRELQFGEWLRDDIEAGVFEAPCPDHDLALLITQARARSVVLIGQPATALFEPVPPADLRRALLDTVAQWRQPADWAGDARNIVLALARSWYTAATGEITSKDGAANWLLPQIAPAHQAVMRMARDSYLGAATDGLAHRTDEVADFVGYARAAVERLASE